MANYLRPRRGKRSTAESQDIILKKGEIFFEAPDTGVGKGAGRIKIGDGVTPYTSLPYFYDYTNFVTDLVNSTITFTPTAEENNNILLNRIIPGAKISIIIAAIKNLLYNHNETINTLVDNMNSYKYTDPVDCSIGDETCTIIDSSITTDSIIEIFTFNESGTVLSVEDVDVTSGQAVLTFDALEEATSFRLRVTNL